MNIHKLKTGASTQKDKHLQRLSYYFLIALLAACALWLFPIYYFANGDGFMMLYGAHAVLNDGVAHMDFNNLMRPGYLLNVPFVSMGLNFYGLRVVYLIVSVLIAWVLTLGLCDQGDRRYYFPAISLLIFACNISYTQFLFNYVDVTFLGLMLCLGAFSVANQVHSKQRFWLFLAAFSGTIAAFGNLALMPMAIVSILLLGLAYPVKRETAIFWFVSLVLIIAFSLIYFIEWGVYQRLAVDGIFKLWHFNTAHARLTWLFGILLWISVFLLGAVSALILTKLASIHARALWLLAGVLAITVLVAMRYFNLSQQWAMVTPFAIGLASLAAWLLVPKDSRRYFICLHILIIGLMISHRFSSHMLGVESDYVPCLLIIQGLNIGARSRFHLMALIYAGLTFFNCLFVSIDSVPGGFYWMWSNKVDPGLGVRVDPVGATTYLKFKRIYSEQHCAQKAFLSFEDFPSLYLIVNRRAAFDTSLISRFIVAPLNQQTLGANIIHWLSHKQRWCVAYSSGAGEARFEKPYGRDQVLPYLQSTATKVVTVGRFPYRGNSELSLYVKS